MNKPSCGSSRNVIFVVALCLIGFLLFGTARLSGQLFVACIERFNTGRKEASLPFVLCFTVRNLLGPIVGYLGNKFGLQSITWSGCLLAAISIGGCFFVEDIVSFTVLWGGGFGIAFGMGTSLFPNLLHLSFKKSFNRMYGTVLVGGCMGAILLPVIIEALLKSYGFSGALLILSGLILHCVPAAMLLRRPQMPLTVKIISKIHETQQKVKIEETECFENSSALNDKFRNGTKINVISPSKSNLLNTEKTDLVERVEMKIDLTIKETTKVNSRHRNCTDSQSHPVSSFSGAQLQEGLDDVTFMKSHSPPKKCLNKTVHVNEFQEIVAGTQVTGKLDDGTMNESPSPRTNVLNPNTVTHNNEIHTPETIQMTSESSGSNLGTKLNVEKDQIKHVPKQSTSVTQNFRLFLDPAYILILMSFGISLVVITATYTVIVDVCRDKGITEDITVVMTFAITDMLGRLFFGYLADGGCVSQLNIFVLCYGCCGLLFMVFPWLIGFYAVVILVAGIGALMGGIIVLPVGMIGDYIEKDYLTMAFSSRNFLFALLSFSESPVIGYFRETLKSYDGLLYLLGSMCFLGTLITLLIPPTARCRDNRKCFFKNKQMLSVT